MATIRALLPVAGHCLAVGVQHVRSHSQSVEAAGNPRAHPAHRRVVDALSASVVFLRLRQRQGRQRARLYRRAAVHRARDPAVCVFGAVAVAADARAAHPGVCAGVRPAVPLRGADAPVRARRAAVVLRKVRLPQTVLPHERRPGTVGSLGRHIRGALLQHHVCQGRQGGVRHLSQPARRLAVPDGHVRAAARAFPVVVRAMGVVVGAVPAAPLSGGSSRRRRVRRSVVLLPRPAAPAWRRRYASIPARRLPADSAPPLRHASTWFKNRIYVDSTPSPRPFHRSRLYTLFLGGVSTAVPVDPGALPDRPHPVRASRSHLSRLALLPARIFYPHTAPVSPCPTTPHPPRPIPTESVVGAAWRWEAGDAGARTAGRYWHPRKRRACVREFAFRAVGGEEA
eukprot:ctg_3904.g581